MLIQFEYITVFSGVLKSQLGKGSKYENQIYFDLGNFTLYAQSQMLILFKLYNLSSCVINFLVDIANGVFNLISERPFLLIFKF